VVRARINGRDNCDALVRWEISMAGTDVAGWAEGDPRKSSISWLVGD
jgi:hypothetical protein